MTSKQVAAIIDADRNGEIQLPDGTYTSPALGALVGCGKPTPEAIREAQRNAAKSVVADFPIPSPEECDREMKILLDGHASVV